MTGAMTANDRSYDYDLMKRKKQAANNANLRIVAIHQPKAFLAKNKQSSSSKSLFGELPPSWETDSPMQLVPNQVSSPQQQPLKNSHLLVEAVGKQIVDMIYRLNFPECHPCVQFIPDSSNCSVIFKNTSQ